MKRVPLCFIRRIFCCILFLSALTACGRTSQPLKVTKVTSVPENFVLLSEIQAKHENIFQYSIYADAVIYFTDLDDRTIDSQQLNDASILVSYQDEWYVEETMIQEVIASAQRSAALREKLFSVGEVVQLYAFTFADSIFFTIQNVSYEENHLSFDTADGYKLCIVDFTVVNGEKDIQSITEYFQKVTTDSGTEYSDFAELSSTSVGIEVPVDETVTYIYVKSPTRENNIRMIGVS